MDTTATREMLKKVRQVELRTRRLVTDVLAGEYHSVFRGRGIDFDEVREYTPGDEVRLIDWNVTARTGTAFIKKLREERELTILLAVDVSASGKFGSQTQSKRELAAEIASVLAFSAIRNRDKVGLVLFSDEVEQFIPPTKGRQHVLRVIREILFCKPKRRGTDISSALDFIADVQRRRAVVFVISDFIESPEAFEAAAETNSAPTNRRHDLVLLHLRDRHEEELPALGLLTLEDTETGEIREIDTRSHHVRDAFRRRALERMDAFRRAARQADVDVLELRTGEPYHIALFTFFQNRASRRLGLDSRTLSVFWPTLVPDDHPGYPSALSLLRPWRGRLLWLLLALIVLRNPLAAIILAIWWPRRQLSAKSAYELALEKLERARGLIREDKPMPYAVAVSETVRTYLGQRFNAPSTRRTTEEFLRLMQADRATPLAEHSDLLREFLQSCDLVKFARYQPRLAELEHVQKRARDFVLATKPQEPSSQRNGRHAS